jgi:hypothetical protein
MLIGPFHDDTEREFRVEAVFRFPVTVHSATEVSQRSTYSSRIEPRQSWYDGLHFSFAPYPFREKLRGDDLVRGRQTEPASLKTRVWAPTPMEAAVKARRPMFFALDDLAFQLQAPLSIERLDLIDITAPVTSDDLREAATYSGFDDLRSRRSLGLGEFEITEKPILRDLDRGANPRVSDALDWYMKGLAAENDADRFIFFWVCFEIIVGIGDIKLYSPQGLAGCAHEIDDCPECGKPALHYNQARTNRAVLKALGVSDPQTTKRLWEMRQIVHGAHSFTELQSQDLYECMSTIRTATFRALKQMLRWRVDSAPKETGKGVSMHMAFQAATPRAVTRWDLIDLDVPQAGDG